MNIRAIFSIISTLMFSNLLFGGDFQKSDLIGEWNGKAPDGAKVSYCFDKNGLVTNYVDSPGFKQLFPNGMTGKYVVREKSPFWEIDIYDFEDSRFKEITLQGILQPIDKGKFKMEGTPSNHGPRPKDFDEQAIVFTKVENKHG
jgi:hypothetical protein